MIVQTLRRQAQIMAVDPFTEPEAHPSSGRHSHGLSEGNQLIESSAPAGMKSHILMSLAGSRIGVHHQGRVLGPASMWFERDDGCEVERIARTCCRRFVRPVSWRDCVGPDEPFVLDDLQVTTDVREGLSLRRPHHRAENATW